MNNFEHELLVDGNTLINVWDYFGDFEDQNIYMSASNFYLAKLTILANKRAAFFKFNRKKKAEFLDRFKEIANVIESRDFEEKIKNFIKDEDKLFMETIIVNPDLNVGLTIFKGFGLAKAPTVKIASTLEETVGFAVYKKSKMEEIPLFTVNDQLLDFTNTYNYNLNVTTIE